MKCISEEQIQYYLDSECSQAECEEIRQHLAQCRSCSTSFTEHSERLAKAKHSLELLITQEPDIPLFMVPVRTKKHRSHILRYFLPLVVAAGLLLLFLLRPFHKTEMLPPDELYLQTFTYEEHDANKPVTQYPLIMTIIAPDGSIAQTVIN